MQFQCNWISGGAAQLEEGTCRTLKKVDVEGKYLHIQKMKKYQLMLLPCMLTQAAYHW